MPVNDAVTDSVTQVNTNVVGETPALAGGNLMISTSQALGTSALNSTGANQQATIVHQTSTVQGINSLFATGGAVLGRSIQVIFEKSAS
ncbi:glycerol-3-phosphate dehydrogenase subunit C [Grimontia sp. S25]|uniref:Glycerol-3-phosphate dehydrogenase subunit C n=1 Tax=Grimontia sedimenti TaxID=2711294 RepID=A0A6M1RJ80_9GAMM|nr:RebB family R body protein [Grimontia sedimenti]NGN96237.1 glycerol-3-phosphate dehydrogenase subunit C [Grimontia sedimenti]